MAKENNNLPAPQSEASCLRADLPAPSLRQAGTHRQARQAGGDKTAGDYKDVPGFCKSATIEEIRKHNHILTPGRYVGAAEVEDDGEPFEEKMARLTTALREQTEQAKKLDQLIWANLEDIG